MLRRDKLVTKIFRFLFKIIFFTSTLLFKLNHSLLNAWFKFSSLKSCSSPKFLYFNSFLLILFHFLVDRKNITLCLSLRCLFLTVSNRSYSFCLSYKDFDNSRYVFSVKRRLFLVSWYIFFNYFLLCLCSV